MINIRPSLYIYMLLILASSCLSGFALASKALYLDISEAMPLQYDAPIETVFIADPEIADYKVIDDRNLVIYGRSVGRTSFVALGSNGEMVDRKILIIDQNLTTVREQVRVRFADVHIDITSLGDQVILSGTVPSEEVSQDIYNLVGEVLGRKVTEDKFKWKDDGVEGNNIRFMTRRSYAGLVNNLQVSVVKQINVKLTVAEVSHSFIRQLGVKWGSEVGQGSGSLFLGNGQFYNKIGHLSSNKITNFISAADDDAMGQVLAEPNLSVLSGETASFLAGGEMPIVTFVDGSQNITYKEFGIRLTLAAKAEKDDTINLSLEPEVSSIDTANSNNKLGIPAFKTRRTRTTIQLADGESFVLGGLLSSEDREKLSKVPLAGDIPVLGAAFRHTDNQRNKTELIIVATVNLVKPVPAGAIQLPLMNRTDTLLRYFHLDLKNEQASVASQSQEILATGGFKQ